MVHHVYGMVVMKYNTLSVVVPCYNEGPCVELFLKAVNELPIAPTIEYVFVDDGSKDDTLARIKAAAEKDPRIRYVSFSRNFGKEAGLIAGLEHATGDLVVTMDADLQHRPELLPAMVKALEEEGYDCVATRRANRTGEPVLRSWFAHLFYGLMNRFSDVSLVDGSMDYRMMTRQVVDAVLRLQEANRFTKGIYQWVGFRTKWLETENVERAAGTTKWSFLSLFSYSVRGILAFSTAPLQLASFLGIACCGVSFFYTLYIFVKWMLCGDPVTGWPTLMCVVLMLGGLQLFVIGILGTYLAGVCREVKRRPLYVIRESK